MTDNANVLLGLDIKSSLNKPKEILSFVSKVLSGMETKTFSVTNSFSPFMFNNPTVNKIYDFKLAAIIPPDEQDEFEQQKFKIKRVENDIKLQYNNEDFPYPYCLLVLSLSNYLNLDDLPSYFIQSKPLGELNETYLQKICDAMVKYSNRLSAVQTKYESYLLAYLKTYMAIKTCENVQRQAGSTDRDLKLIAGYNAAFEFADFENDFEKMQSTGRALYNKYYPWASQIKAAIEKSEKNLDNSDLCSNVFNLKKVKCEKITNQNLSTLYQFQSTASGLSYLRQVKFSFDIEGKIKECETYIYENKFKQICDELKAKDQTVQPSTLQTLNTLKKAYSYCKICQDEAFIAEKEYSTITANKRIRDVNSIVIRASKNLADFLVDCDKWYSSNNAKIQDSKDSNGVVKLEFDFDSTSYQSDLNSIRAFQQRLEGLRDTNNRGDAEDAEKELDILIDKFRMNYFNRVKPVGS